MRLYVDTSVVLRLLLGEPEPFAVWGAWDRAFISELGRIEGARAIDRLRLTGAYEDEDVARARMALERILGQLDHVGVSPAVLEGAALPMPTVVGTLDALHLATALAVRAAVAPDLEFATHDLRQARAARGLGFAVLGV